jgi:serine phosphatase RsbU (regulator of sigma subunit)
VLGVGVRVDALPVIAMADLDRVVEALREQQNALSAEMEFTRSSQAGLLDRYKPSS